MSSLRSVATAAVALLCVTGMFVGFVSFAPGTAFADTESNTTFYGFEDEPTDSGVADGLQIFQNADPSTFEVSNTRSRSGSQSFYAEFGSTADYTNPLAFAPDHQPLHEPTTANVSASYYLENGVTDFHLSAEESTEIVDITLNSSGLYYDDGGDDTSVGTTQLTSNVGTGQWLDIEVYDIDPASQTYSVSWNTDTGSGQEVDIPFDYDVSSGYTITSQVLFPETSIYYDDLNLPKGEAINGTVTSDGAPVPNATVEILQTNKTTLENMGYNSPQELLDKAQQINSRINDWNTSHFKNFVSDVSDRSNLLQSQEFQAADASRYVAMHTREDWTGVGGDITLEEPMVSADPGDRLVFSVWEQSGNIFENTIDGQLPGATVDDDLVITQIGPENGTINEMTVETEDYAGTVNPIGKSIEAAEFTLSEGFYIVQPESGGLAYTIRVGDPTAGYFPDLKNEADQLIDRANYIQGLFEDDILETETVVTDSDGEFQLDVPSTVQSTNLVAYKAPDSIREALSTDPRNISAEMVRSYVEGKKDEIMDGSFEMPSVHVQTEMVSAEPGDTVEVPVKEVSAPQFTDMNITQELWDQLQEFLDNNNYAAAMDFIASNLDELPTEEARERFEDIAALIADNQVLTDRSNDLIEKTEGLNTTIEEIRNNLNTTDGETIVDAIEAMQQSLNEQGSDIGSGDGTSEIANETLSASRSFATSLGADDVAAVIQYSDGTSETITPDSEYMTIDSSPIPGMDDVVTIEEYPIKDGAAALAVQWRVVTEEGVGRATDRATNPAFGGDIPGLRSIDLSTMAPGPDELVRMDLHPDKRSTFGDVQAVNVYAPDGSTIQSSLVDGDTAEFSTAGEGAHTVEIVYQNAGGRNFTTNFDIVSQSTDRTMPAGIRVREAAIGNYAITGDGLEGGDVEISNGGATVSLSGIVESSDSIPGELHVYAHGISMAPETTTNIALVQGDEERSISRSYRTVWHGPGIGLNALPWRVVQGEEYALPADEGSIGWINRTSTSATVHTVSGPDGRVGILTNSDPGLTDRVDHWVNLQRQAIPDIGNILG